MTFMGSRTLALGVPLVYLLGTAAVLWQGRTAAARWGVAHAMAGLAMVTCGLAVAMRFLEVFRGFEPAAGLLDAFVSVDLVAFAMLGLATTLGWIIVRFSRVYLEGEQAQPRYVVALLTTLASVSLVAISNHLLLLVLGWIATSLSLHGLLTFYSGRPWALMAAHKKFLASRLAEVCLAGVLLLIWFQLDTLSITAIAAAVQERDTLSLPLHTAAVLLALATILKSAQLPVHGWLLQVMEAPTPVSALLHAGIVNLGGFVLIRMAPMISAAPAAQTLLVLVGSVTAIVAALVMTTRISIKVKLAWSTCAQMGFMLLECGLGLYELALLHLVAHSIYKAHAFLTAAGTVTHARLHRMVPDAAHASATLQSVGAVVGVSVVAGSMWVWSQVDAATHMPWPFVLIAGVGLTPVAVRLGTGPVWNRLRAALGVALLAQLPVLWHRLMSMAPIGPVQPLDPLLLSWTALCGVALFLIQSQIVARPDGPLARSLYPWCYAGFYLDERFTRLTFRLWPLRMPAASGAVHLVPAPVHTGGSL